MTLSGIPSGPFLGKGVLSFGKNTIMVPFQMNLCEGTYSMRTEAKHQVNMLVVVTLHKMILEYQETFDIS